MKYKTVMPSSRKEMRFQKDITAAKDIINESRILNLIREKIRNGIIHIIYHESS